MARDLKRIREEIAGVLSILIALYGALSLVTYDRWDRSLSTSSTEPVSNWGGVLGAYLSDLVISAVGYAAVLVPVFLVLYGVRRLLSMERHRLHLLGAAMLGIGTALLAGLVTSTFGFSPDIRPGGIVGSAGGSGLVRMLSVPGAFIAAISVFVTSVILLSPIPFSSLLLRKKEEIEEAPDSGLIEEEVFVVRHDVADEAPDPEPAPAPKPRRPSALHQASAPKQATRGGFTLPPVDVLNEYEAAEAGSGSDERAANSAMLRSKLAHFGLDGEIDEKNILSGPVITLYRFRPAPKVKINQVVALSDDLALALKAQRIRVARILDDNSIGIEVPNRSRQVVGFRQIVSSAEFQKSQSKLTLALGKDISGRPVVADLTKMPHLLVAGTTGAGKSVSINSMVMSMLYKATPREVKMLMIDPKLLELSNYRGIPHLIADVITSPKESAEALRKMVFEMERRYRVLAEKGARNIDAYNRSVSEDEQMPYIVVFIDELADLMFASSREIEDSIARLAQMARAAGIHLIIATQRPSVDVITGVIKANFPARISFHVLSKIDSRTILDQQGAEQLLGKGDMLLLVPGADLMRIHGALVTDTEIRAVTDFVRSQAAPDYSLFSQLPTEQPSEESEDDDRDEMYDRTLDFAESVGEVSISSIQRRFKIGYNRAARIMELLERDGHVGPSKGAGKPREFRRHGFRG